MFIVPPGATIDPRTVVVFPAKETVARGLCRDGSAITHDQIASDVNLAGETDPGRVEGEIDWRAQGLRQENGRKHHALAA